MARPATSLSSQSVPCVTSAAPSAVSLARLQAEIVSGTTICSQSQVRMITPTNHRSPCRGCCRWPWRPHRRGRGCRWRPSRCWSAVVVAPRSLKLPVLCLCSILRLRSQPSSRDSFSDLVTVSSRECLIELETKVYPKVRNHKEGPYYLLWVNILILS